MVKEVNTKKRLFMVYRPNTGKQLKLETYADIRKRCKKVLSPANLCIKPFGNSLWLQLKPDWHAFQCIYFFLRLNRFFLMRQNSAGLISTKLQRLFALMPIGECPFYNFQKCLGFFVCFFFK